MKTNAYDIVKKYTKEHLAYEDQDAKFEVYEVWRCYILGNIKVMMTTSLPDGMYYEVTYNGEKDEFYLDAYKKFDNKCIKAE
jgi:hypothetical protein